MKRQVVCLCGSGRFTQQIQKHAHELSLAGYVVLMPHVNTSEGNSTVDPVEKCRLDVLHLDKITMADGVLVVCPDGYVGESTAREMFFAQRTGKIITFTHPKAFIELLDDPLRQHLLHEADRFVLQNYRKYGSVGVAPATDGVLAAWRVSRCSVTPEDAAQVVHTETKALRENLVLVLNLLERAWGVIANAPVPKWGGGDPNVWVGIAETWRDDFHVVLKSDHPAMVMTMDLRRKAALRERLQRVIDMVRSTPVGDPDLLSSVRVEVESIGPLLAGWAGPEIPAKPAEG